MDTFRFVSRFDVVQPMRLRKIQLHEISYFAGRAHRQNSIERFSPNIYNCSNFISFASVPTDGVDADERAIEIHFRARNAEAEMSRRSIFLTENK